MRRRQFLKAGAALSLGAFAGCGGGGGNDMPHGGGSEAAGSPVRLPEGAPLRWLERLPNRSTESGVFEATLIARPTLIDLAAGVQTEFWAFNGSVPGPLIEVSEGDLVRIQLINNLPGNDSTIHWHGLPVPPNQDGNPMDPVRAGGTRLYEFRLPIGSAGTYWYHPHPHPGTAEQVFRGLAGMLIVRPPLDPIPAGIAEKHLFITDLRLEANGRIAPNRSIDQLNGREGDVLLVNGQHQPRVSVRSGERQRWRIVNATNARYLRLNLSGHAFSLIGTDGGLLASPRDGLSEILLAPAERVEVVVSATLEPGATASLRALPYDRGRMRMGMGANPVAREVPVLTLAYAPESPVTAVDLPLQLRPIQSLGDPVARNRLVLSESMGMMMGAMGGQFLINGKSFDISRVDWLTQAGQVERWDIVNESGMDHPIHIHGTQFQVTSRTRNGRTTPEAFLAWRDTVNVATGETVELRTVQNQRGKRMFHCHILEHEEQGMMGVLEVV